MKNKATFCSFFAKLITFLAILSSFAYLVPPDKFVYLAFVGLLFPWLQIINVLVILFGLSKPSCPVRYNVVAFLVSLSMLNNYLSFDKEREVYGQADRFSVMTYNIKSQRVFDTNNKKLRPELDSLISVRYPDIVCIQEGGLYSPSTIPKSINIGGRSYYIWHTSMANIIFSRFPISNAGGIPFDHTSNSVVYADLSINNTQVRIYNCHLQSFRINPSEYKLYDNTLQFKSKKQRLLKGKEFLVKMSTGFKVRAKQARIVREHINKSNMLTVVCGDFNSTPSSYVYHTIKKDLEDAFVERGFGYGASYKRNFIGVRIDYVLHSPNIGANSYETIPQMSSDHCPVYTTFHIK